jgi:hypothetical protein
MDLQDLISLKTSYLPQRVEPKENTNKIILLI